MTPFETLVHTHRGVLRAYLHRLTRDRQLAEDIIQETWLRAWRHGDRLTNNPDIVRPWLLRVAHNVAVDMHRQRQARAREVPYEVDPTSCPASTDEVLGNVVVERLLATLPVPHRQTVAEVCLADRTAKQAADRLGVPVGTIKSRMHYALRALRATVGAPMGATAGPRLAG